MIDVRAAVATAGEVRHPRVMARKTARAPATVQTERSDWLRSLTDHMRYEVPVGCQWLIHYVKLGDIVSPRRHFRGPDLDYRLTEAEFLRRFETPGRYWFAPLTAAGKRMRRVMAYYDRPAT